MMTIGVIGGGFCGTMTAVNLSRLSDESLRVVLINSKRPMGRGTAYGTRRSEHLLNVAARNMSAFPDQPAHFVDWLQSRFEFADKPIESLRELFAPRRVYGDYLSGLLANCKNPIDARSHTVVETVEYEATAVEENEDGGLRIELADGPAIDVDRVVLATGNQPPAAFPSSSPLRYDPRYRSDPWDDWLSRLPPPGGKIVLLGTGLTMVDIVLTLADIEWQGSIVAVSRNGRLPKSHFRGIAYEDYVPDDAESLGLSGLRKLVQTHCERLRQMSQNSAIAIDKLRPHTQRLWQSFSKEEKAEFLSKDAAEWNVTRHRIAAAVHSRVTDALESGRLQVVAGTITELVPQEQCIDVVLETAGGQTEKQPGDLVINCTGPQLRFSQTPSPLFQSLMKQDLAAIDEMDMGLAVDEDFTVLDQNGNCSRRIFAIGPMLRGSLWETTAVPELRVQAMRLAEHLLQKEPTGVRQDEVLEYYI